MRKSERKARARLQLIILAAMLMLWLGGMPAGVRAQSTPEPPTPRPGLDPPPAVPNAVEISPTALDAQIAARLDSILEATDWFQDTQVSVENGVVFLSGRTSDASYRTWAGELASKTRDVVAVVNRIEVIERSPWDVTPAFEEVEQLIRRGIRAMPLLALAIVVMILTWFGRRLAVHLARPIVARRVQNPLLRNLAARLFAFPVVLFGVYLVLQFLGLTRLALTVLGGTGIAGLVVGIAFRDTVENLLASILISTDQPFKTGDTVQIGDRTGIVQGVTTRATLMMGFDGNHIQIPNATVYKSEIINFSANPNQRLSFTVGISYDSSITVAQEAVLDVLRQHPAVLKDPEPLVLADRLGPSAVELIVYFWIDGKEHNAPKVKSAVLRLTKRALRASNVVLPHPGREVVFPRGVPVDGLRLFGRGERRGAPKDDGRPADQDDSRPVTPAEGRLESDEEQMQKQAEQSRPPTAGTNLLPE